MKRKLSVAAERTTKKPKTTQPQLLQSTPNSSNGQSRINPKAASTKKEPSSTSSLTSPLATSTATSSAVTSNTRESLRKAIEELLPTSALFQQKIAGQFLLLENPVRALSAEAVETRARARRLSQTQRKCLSSRDRAAQHWTHIAAGSLRYESVYPLHSLWLQYMEDAFGDELSRGKSLDEHRLLKADFHGAILTVTRSKLPQLIGRAGIMVQETQSSFRLLDAEHRLVVAPKAHSVFSFSFADRTIRLFGNQLVMRAAERTVKKFKQKCTIEL